jgi:hypothetical protein
MTVKGAGVVVGTRPMRRGIRELFVLVAIRAFQIDRAVGNLNSRSGNPSFQSFGFSSRTMSVWCYHVASVKGPVPSGYRGAPCWPILAYAVGDLISNPYPRALLLVNRQVSKWDAEEVPRCPLAVSPAASSRPDRHNSGGTFPLHLLPFLW